MCRKLFLASCLSGIMLLSGCGGEHKLALFPEETGTIYSRPSPIVASDPGGPIPAPRVPADLAAYALPEGRPAPNGAPGASPNISPGGSPGAPHDAAPKTGLGAIPGAIPGAILGAIPTDPFGLKKGSISYAVLASSPDDPELAETFAKISPLYTLGPPESLTELEQRLNAALRDATSVLHSYGYYSGQVAGRVEIAGESRPLGDISGWERDALFNGKVPNLTVHVDFTPGPRYTVGKNRIEIVGQACAAVHEDGRPVENMNAAALAAICKPAAFQPVVENQNIPPFLPQSLADVGLAAGAPAKASDVLAAADRLVDVFQNSGYPFAELVSSHYIVDHSTQTLEATLRLNPGDFVRMGELRVQGCDTVSQNYLKAKSTWKPGSPWNQRRVDAYVDALRQSGLFSAISLKPGQPEQTDESDKAYIRPVELNMTTLPEHTVGGSVKYNSDIGVGVEGYWEDRNLTGRGDKLRAEAPLWQDMQEVNLDYRLPYFLSPSQDFNIHAALLHQDTDAYKLLAALAYAGIDRRFSRNWVGSVKVSGEGGQVQEPGEDQHSYYMVGLPVSAVYSTVKKPLDATSGVRVALSGGPYTGEYNGPFTIARGRLDAAAFVPLAGQDTVVLALRGSGGAISGAAADDVPNTVRFYSGGGGSVRGYAYQSLGPQNSDGDPLGGAYMVEASGELRVKFTPEWGVTAFVDGGNVSVDAQSLLGNSMQWGAGLGLRYYTAIGPVRLDVATPLNPRKDDDSFQFYISIGQSF